MRSVYVLLALALMSPTVASVQDVNITPSGVSHSFAAPPPGCEHPGNMNWEPYHKFYSPNYGEAWIRYGYYNRETARGIGYCHIYFRRGYDRNTNIAIGYVLQYGETTAVHGTATTWEDDVPNQGRWRVVYEHRVDQRDPHNYHVGVITAYPL